MKRISNRFKLLILLCLVLMSGGVYFGVVRWRQHTADHVIQQRLLGKWQVWDASANLSQPHARIIELRPGGHTSHFSPTLEPWVKTENLYGKWTWYIDDGKMILEVDDPSNKPKFQRDVYELAWNSQNEFILQEHDYAHPIPHRYRRLPVAVE